MLRQIEKAVKIRRGEDGERGGKTGRGWVGSRWNYWELMVAVGEGREGVYLDKTKEMCW